MIYVHFTELSTFLIASSRCSLWWYFMLHVSGL